MKKKILFYYLRGINDGGSDYSLFNHIKYLDKTRFEPLVLYRDKGHLVSELNKNGVNLFKHNFLTSNNRNNENPIKNILIKYMPGSKTIRYTFKSFVEILFLIKFILLNKIDLIHLNHGINYDRPALIAGILTRRSVISHYRGLSKLSNPDVFLTKFVEKIICISEYARLEYLQCGVLPSKCIKVYNGIDLVKFSKKVFPTNISQVIIGSIGRFEQWKGQHILLKAIPEIIKLHSNTKFVFVGSGTQKDNLIKLSKELEIESHVVFKKPVDNITEVFNTFSIFVHTAIKPEPFGRVIIEAMATGLPVISTNIGGPKEIIKNNWDGYLIEPQNLKILTEKIIYLINNPEARIQLGNNAIKTVQEKYDAKITTKNIEKLYQETIKS